MFKYTVFNRDSFTCQNKVKEEVDDDIFVFMPCPYCKNEKYFPKLTVHHIRHQRNFKDKHGNWIGNPNKPRNGVLVCQDSHNAFNGNKIGLAFDKNAVNLPPHIRNQVLWLHNPIKINWKKLKKENEKLRKKLKFQLEVDGLMKTIRQLPIGKRTWYSLPIAQIIIMFHWLNNPFYADED